MSIMIWNQTVFYTLIVFLKEVLENINFEIKKISTITPKKMEQVP